RVRSRHVAEREELADRQRRRASWHGRVLEHRLHLGGEDDVRTQQTVIQRLDADTVSCEKKLPLLPVPEREGEHTVELSQPLFPLVDEPVEQDLGVRVRAEDVAAALEITAQLDVVV